jgi:hypothetical protein
MELNKLDVHVENFLPGALILAELTMQVPRSVLGPQRQQFEWLIQQAVPGAVIFIAASYLLGVLAVTLSKFLMDGPSGSTLRPALLKRRYPEHFSGQSRSKINDHFGRTIWAAERDAAEDRRHEIQKRRERARLIRSSLLPAMIGIFITVHSAGVGFALVVACYCLILFLYAYSEVEIFRACRREIGAEHSAPPISR